MFGSLIPPVCKFLTADIALFGAELTALYNKEEGN